MYRPPSAYVPQESGILWGHEMLDVSAAINHQAWSRLSKIFDFCQKLLSFWERLPGNPNTRYAFDGQTAAYDMVHYAFFFFFQIKSNQSLFVWRFSYKNVARSALQRLKTTEKKETANQIKRRKSKEPNPPSTTDMHRESKQQGYREYMRTDSTELQRRGKNRPRQREQERRQRQGIRPTVEFLIPSLKCRTASWRIYEFTPDASYLLSSL